MSIPAVCLVAVLLLLDGCGFYSFTGAIPPHIKTITIPLFVNETAEFGIAEAVTDEVTNVFIRENILKIGRSEATDSVLRGTIKKVADTPYTYSKAEEVIDYRLTITVDVEWLDVEREETLLKKKYTGWGTYSLTQDYSSDGIDNDDDGRIDGDDPDEMGDARTLAAKVAVGKIAADIISDITSTW
ncbi:MAG: LptE family protein [Fidelibacterota bacterium]